MPVSLLHLYNVLLSAGLIRGVQWWKIVENGGDCWTVEDNYVKIPNFTVGKILCHLLLMTHVFKDYGPGVRFIAFTMREDTQFWAGWYGIRVH
ncbi:hypothetical protein cypCar_00013626 [Cyprinus carpio]|nr:hypothetical protein cypCar_00013626 [Cyprinus carpio]